MGINFHHDKNRLSYASRQVDSSWKDRIKALVPVENIERAVDIGCGGGIYSRALSEMGIKSITAVDYSQTILDSAKERNKEYDQITFKYGIAHETGLPSEQFDLLLERAVIHHLEDLNAAFKEAHRLLKYDGYLIIQDRTKEDCLLDGSDEHIRGYFFSRFPKLIEYETKRRHSSKKVISALKELGFMEIEEIKLWEVRKIHKTKEAFLEDIRGRTGRSILHHLNESELENLISYLDTVIRNYDSIVEKDRWTIWKAVK
ncbi:class I SAM-dependent methyltransferase [Evansella sp. AB-P1]|uniref:class I SAM-dependent methyltransferase n=1 Tax=Evansella sp. AB-P1 TaxID=3037653 RepID=UPI00241D84AD|nr:class I SAM-dependent methyltransferase [Evansella sp. AB-P1]MDG5785995.1 class I SAM-dependent methyltransferase [Evansella sp. AB-P1]